MLKETPVQSPSNTQDLKTFDNFKQVKGSEVALELFKCLANGSTSWFMLLCYGTAGCGKTHLCKALSIALNKRDLFCRVLEWPSIIRNLKLSMNSECRGLYDDIFKNLCNADRLIMDDVGMGGTGSSWEWGEFEEIICYRYEKNLLTVVTTNLDITELPDRVVSRFRDKTKARIVHHAAGDYRPKK